MKNKIIIWICILVCLSSIALADELLDSFTIVDNLNAQAIDNCNGDPGSGGLTMGQPVNITSTIMSGQNISVELYHSTSTELTASEKINFSIVKANSTGLPDPTDKTIYAKVLLSGNQINDVSGWSGQNMTMKVLNTITPDMYAVIFQIYEGTDEKKYYVQENSAASGIKLPAYGNFKMSGCDPFGLTNLDYISRLFLFKLHNKTVNTTIPTSNVTTRIFSSYNLQELSTYTINLSGNIFNVNQLGTYDTKLPDNQTYEVTVNATGFSTHYNYTFNASEGANFVAYLSPLNITIHSQTLKYYFPNVGSLVNISLNYTIPNNQSYNITHYVYNLNDTTEWVNNTNYTILNGDYFNTLRFNSTICTPYTCTASEVDLIDQEDIDKIFTLNIYGFLGNLLSSVSLIVNNTNYTESSNPLSTYLSNFIPFPSPNNSTVLVNVTDGTLTHVSQNYQVNLSENQSDYNLTMSPNQLVLSFFQAGSSKDTEGWVADSEKIYRFNETPLLVVQQNLTEGYIHVRFGSTEGVNHTQYFEYINDFETHIAEDIEVLAQTDWSFYIRVLDRTNTPIKDATIRAEFSFSELNNWTYHKLMGQRLTDDQGYTFFIADSRTELLITITKDGYEPIEQLLTVGDESFSKDSPLEFYLVESDEGVLDNAWLYIRRDYKNDTLLMNGTLTAKGRSLVSYNTDYRISQGLSARDISHTKDEHDRFTFTLSESVDYDLTLESDFVLYVYLDGSLWKTFTIDYKTQPETQILQGITFPIIGFLLIWLLVPLIISHAFNTLEGGVSAFFFIGLFAVALNTTLIWITAVSAIYIIFKLILGGLLKE